jgi:hypothetical protein
MQLLLMLTFVVLIIIGSVLLFLKFIRTTVLNCLSIKRIIWGTVRVKLVDCKIAVEIVGLTVELLLLCGDVPLSPVQNVMKSSDKQPNLNQNINSRTTMIRRIVSSNVKSVLSYLLSCFTIVLTQCALQIETIEGDQLAVSLRFYYLFWNRSILPVVASAICFCVCLTVCLSACLCVYLSVYLSVCLSLCPSACLSFFLSICLCLSICLSISLSFLLSVCQSV